MNGSRRDLLIAWSLLPFLTPTRTRLLREVFEPIEAVCNASSSVVEGLLRLAPDEAMLVKSPLTTETRSRIAALRDSMITIDDAEYPRLLREIFDPPLALHVRGDRSILQRTCVAIVGSRRASPYAINVAGQLARQLAAAGVVIVSGLALGVDAAAHRAALEAGGTTIGVLGTGIDVVYPPANKPLFRDMEAQGAIVTEFPPGSPALRGHFPIRNRLIAGLAMGTVIVEATSRSGSLITARMALEQNREVFAVPGSIFSAGSEGTHRLIQYGAKLVHDVDDILDELPDEFRAKREAPPPVPDELRDVLEVFTREDGTHVDAVAEKLGQTPVAIAESLLQLELEGWIRALPGSRYVRVR